MSNMSSFGQFYPQKTYCGIYF